MEECWHIKNNMHLDLLQDEKKAEIVCQYIVVNEKLSRHRDNLSEKDYISSLTG